eukprot:UN09561
MFNQQGISTQPTIGNSQQSVLLKPIELVKSLKSNLKIDNNTNNNNQNNNIETQYPSIEHAIDNFISPNTTTTNNNNNNNNNNVSINHTPDDIRKIKMIGTLIGLR